MWGQYEAFILWTCLFYLSNDKTENSLFHTKQLQLHRSTELHVWSVNSNIFRENLCSPNLIITTIQRPNEQGWPTWHILVSAGGVLVTPILCSITWSLCSKLAPLSDACFCKTMNTYDGKEGALYILYAVNKLVRHGHWFVEGCLR